MWRCLLLSALLSVGLSLHPCWGRGPDPRVRVMATSIGYSSAGGAMLGIASLAFGANARAVAQGASIGLYAGIIFGAYVILGNEYKFMGGGESYGEGDIDQFRFWQGDRSDPQWQLQLYRLTF